HGRRPLPPQPTQRPTLHRPPHTSRKRTLRPKRQKTPPHRHHPAPRPPHRSHLPAQQTGIHRRIPPHHPHPAHPGQPAHLRRLEARPNPQVGAPTPRHPRRTNLPHRPRHRT